MKPWWKLLESSWGELILPHEKKETTKDMTDEDSRKPCESEADVDREGCFDEQSIVVAGGSQDGDS